MSRCMRATMSRRRSYEIACRSVRGQTETDDGSPGTALPTAVPVDGARTAPSRPSRLLDEPIVLSVAPDERLNMAVPTRMATALARSHSRGRPSSSRAPSSKTHPCSFRSAEAAPRTAFWVGLALKLCEAFGPLDQVELGERTVCPSFTSPGRVPALAVRQREHRRAVEGCRTPAHPRSALVGAAQRERSNTDIPSERARRSEV